MIDGKSMGSMPRGYSTLMNKSSAGASSRLPPQTRQPFVLWTVSCISLLVRFTGHRVSMRSAVPAGEVIARLLVLGMVYPAAATMGTTRMLVLSPGIPPTLCLSTMGVLLNFMVLPVSTMARLIASFSLMLKPCMLSAVRNAAISTSLRCLSTTSFTISRMSVSRSRSPRTFALTCESDSGSLAS